MDVEEVSEHLGLSDSPEFVQGRSVNRMKYHAEVAVFRKKYGALEDVRARLGLSRRKLSQKLMVDPSAWTRWSKDESKVPPHVYKLLEFYLEGREAAALGLPSLREQVLQEKLGKLELEIEGLKARKSAEFNRVAVLMTVWLTLALLLIWAK